ncbi:MAG: hypothetical protein PGN37_13475 [Mycobacterium kyogaense]|uniref:hypothetical protein n=1 Tax=Mycobacterium kyogaense TaxID=2212479 RepID=UPI002FFCF135
MRKNSATVPSDSADNIEVADMQPVELDPPPAELVHWQKLGEHYAVVKHRDDASTVIGMPRPEWSDPTRDMIGASPFACVYRSRLVKVPVAGYRGMVDHEEGTLAPAWIGVSTHLVGDRNLMVSISLNYELNGDWKATTMRLFLDEATEVADVLLAAVALGEMTADR